MNALDRKLKKIKKKKRRRRISELADKECSHREKMMRTMTGRLSHRKKSEKF